MPLFRKKPKWGNYGGNINLYADLKRSDIAKLAREKEIHAIQLYAFKSPSHQTWEILNQFFEKYPHIGLSIHWDDETNWRFLKRLPAVKRLSLKSYLTKDFSRIANYVDLEQLHIGETKSIAVDLGFIKRFETLKVLSIDGMKKGLGAIENLKHLWSLNLRGVKLRNLDFICELKKLRLLKLMFGSYEDLSAIGKLTELEYLGISRTRRIPNYDFLKTLTKMQFLHFEGLSQMDRIPDLSGQRDLKKIQIEKLSRLGDISSLRALENLKELLLIFPENFKAASREALLRQAIAIMRNLKHLEFTNLFHWNKNGRMRELEKQGIKPWHYGISKWKQNSQGGWTL